jgi:hypothetical protein
MFWPPRGCLPFSALVLGTVLLLTVTGFFVQSGTARHSAARYNVNMPTTATITIGLRTPEEIKFKKMILALKAKDSEKNPYQNRSESEIAKMLLQKVLQKEHERICGHE